MDKFKQPDPNKRITVNSFLFLFLQFISGNAINDPFFIFFLHSNQKWNREANVKVMLKKGLDNSSNSFDINKYVFKMSILLYPCI